MKRIGLSLICLFNSIALHQQVYSQSITPVERGQLDNIPVVFPPAPTEASLGKYGDIPVGKYTGIPNINIPLHELSVGSVKLPISLSYHCSGLKVEESASWVGLGWSLNAGGVITRTVHNKADDGEYGYWNYGSLTPMELTFGNFGSFSTTSPVYLGLFDIEPDIFYFNFLGFSGKFVMEPSGDHKAHCFPFNNLKIEHSSTLSNFSITDTEGNQYLFDVNAKTSIDVGEYISTWYLTKIITPEGNITFTYSDDQHQDLFSTTFESEVWYTKLIGNIYGEKGSQSSVTGQDAYSRVLKQIDAPGQTIRFYTTNLERQDMPSSSTLDYFTVEDDKGLIKKKIGFTHSYFGTPNITYPENSRLKLDGITEYSSNTNDQKIYSLSYYTPQDVPSIHSKAQDIWGYYNGIIGNSTLLLPADPQDYDNLAEPVGGGNRSVNFQKTLSGTLSKITYPTGGSSTFIYEGNDYYNPHHEKMDASVRADAVISTLANVPTQTSSFTIEQGQKVAISYVSYINGIAPTNNGPTFILNRINSDNTRTNIFTEYQSTSQYNGTVTKKYPQLIAGNYEIIASVDGSDQSATIQISYTYLASETIKNSPCGGIRIRQIVNTDPVTGKATTTNFLYKLANDPEASSGVLFSSPTLITEKHGYLVRTSTSSTYLGSTQGSLVGYSMVTQFESSGTDIPNGRTESYFNTYPNNAPSYSANIDTLLTMIPSDGPPVSYIAHPVADGASLMTDNDVYRGNLLREAVYNSSGNLIKETLNAYNIGEQLNPLTAPNYFDLETRQAYVFEERESNVLWDKGWAYFTIAKIPCPWIHIINTVERIYDQNGANPLEKSQNFYYENLDHCQLTKTETTNSKGETITLVNKYPQDAFTGLSTTAEAARLDLINRHNISSVLERTTFKNNTVPINSVHTDYRIWSSGVTSPEFIKASKGQNPYDDRVQFYGYDAFDHALEQSKSSDIHEVHLWGYHNQFPVAKIVGSNYSTVNGIVDQSILDNPSNDAALRTELNKLRTAAVLKDALITTYTYNTVLGVTSETDPNGRTTYYEYDGFGRLSLIKDQNGNIIKAFDYKYFNQ